MQSPKERFEEFLAQKKLRLTAQRRAIVETAFGTHQHFTADQLLEWSRAKDKSVSRATIYRTLPLLTESGLMRELDFGKDQKVYDPNYAEHPHHSHLICQDCGKIFEFESPELDELENKVCRQMGFSPQVRRLKIIAQCEELHRRGSCKKQKN